MLKHLCLHPRFGLCNRLRMIASGIRVARHYGAELSIIFPVGDLRRLIKLPDDIRVIRRKPVPEELFIDSNAVKGGIDFSIRERAYVKGGASFTDVALPPLKSAQYRGYIEPSAEVMDRAARIREGMDVPADFVGLHLRRGDHTPSMRDVPLSLVDKTISGLVGEGRFILLACEDAPLGEHLAGKFSGRLSVLTRKKKPWAGKFIMDEIIEDFAELVLLSEASYVIGSAHSSYSRMAIAFNGNSMSYLLNRNNVQQLN